MADQLILLVEDNLDDEMLTLRTLKRNHIGNKVHVVRDGAEALDFLFGTGAYTDRDLNIMPEMILLDLRLPKVDGLEVLRHVRADKRTSQLPVVIFTSSNSDEDLVDSYHFGANAYIRKPVDFTQFIEAVRQLGLYWMVLNGSPQF